MEGPVKEGYANEGGQSRRQSKMSADQSGDSGAHSGGRRDGLAFVPQLPYTGGESRSVSSLFCMYTHPFRAGY